PGAAAQAESACGRERRQAQAALVGCGEPPERLDGAQAQAMLGLELGVEPASQALVRLEHSDPGLFVAVGPLGQAVIADDVGAAGGFCVRCAGHDACASNYSCRKPRSGGSPGSAETPAQPPRSAACGLAD